MLVVLTNIIRLAIVVNANSVESQPTPHTSWTSDIYPNPQTNLVWCGYRSQPGYVCDPNLLLDDETTTTSGNDTGMQAIEQALAHIRSSTKCACSDGKNASDLGPSDDFCRFDYGYTFSVAIANRMALSEAQLSDENIRREYAGRFAEELRRKWDFGQCGDDAVIFLSVKDYTVWTSVGPMMARVIDADLLHRVAQHAHEKYFQQQHYSAGLLYMIDVYGRALNGEHISIDDKLLPLPLWLIITLSIVIVIVILIIATAVCIRCCAKKKTQEYNLVNNRPPPTSS